MANSLIPRSANRRGPVAIVLALALGTSGCLSLPDGHLASLRIGQSLRRFTQALDPRPLGANLERFPGRLARTVERLRPLHLGALVRLPTSAMRGPRALQKSIVRWPSRAMNTLQASAARAGRRLARLLAQPARGLGAELDLATATRRLRNGVRRIAPTLGLQRPAMPGPTDAERSRDAGGLAPRRRTWVERIIRRLF